MIYGYGFTPGSTVTIAQLHPCAVISQSPSEIVCIAPPAPSAASAPVTAAMGRVTLGPYAVQVNGAATTLTLTYSSDVTPIVRQISPSNISSCITTTIRLTGRK